MHAGMPHHQVDRLDRAIPSQLQLSGIIAGYRADVDRAKAGLGLTAFIELRVEGHSQHTSARIEQALTSIPAVVACYVVSGTAARSRSSTGASRFAAPTVSRVGKSGPLRAEPCPGWCQVRGVRITKP